MTANGERDSYLDVGSTPANFGRDLRRGVMVAGPLALARFEAGRLAEAPAAAGAAEKEARRLGFGQVTSRIAWCGPAPRLLAQC